MNNSERKLDQAQQKLQSIEEELVKTRERQKQNKTIYDELTTKGMAIKEELESMAVSWSVIRDSIQSSRGLHHVSGMEV